MRIGIFGGTFNPIHLGHLVATEEIRQSFDLERVLFVPSARPPHKPSPELIDPAHRLEMTRLAVEENPYFDISAVELNRNDLSYTVETVQFFRKEFGEEAALFFLLGIDSFCDIHSWHDPKRLIGLCNFIVVSRPGFPLKTAYRLLSDTFGIESGEGSRDIPLPNGRTLYLAEVTPVGISSTRVRALLRQGKSVKYLLPEKVESYILLNDLYRTG